MQRWNFPYPCTYIYELLTWLTSPQPYKVINLRQLMVVVLVGDRVFCVNLQLST